MAAADPVRPPGPRLPTAVQTAWMLRDPVRFLERCAERYGPIFHVRFIGFPNWVYVATAALAREVYATDRTVGLAGPARRDFLEPVVGEHSLLCLDGDAWLRQRKLIGPAFHRRHVDRYEDEIASIARRHLASWPRDGELQLRPLMQRITLDVIVRLVLGPGAPERDRRLREALPEVIDAGATAVLWALPDRVVDGLLRSRLARRAPHPLRRFLRRRDEVDALIYAEIAARRRGHGGDDVLSKLVAARDDDGTAMSDIELRDEAMTLLEAGHETTATALSWAVERLVRAPAAMSRLEHELEAGEDTYLEAVVKETLRARSVVLDTPRLLSEAAEIGGYLVPAGTYVAPALPLVQHDSACFADAEQFRPERFLDGARGADGWVPFGGGKRHCVGSHLALLEMKVILRETLRAYALERVDTAAEPPKPAHVTLVPGDLARVRVRRRSAVGPPRLSPRAG